MNRKTITGIVLTISLLLNLIFFVFAFVQKAAADTARDEAAHQAKLYLEQSRLAKAELDQCEGLRAQSDEAREECEHRVLSLSNRK